MPQQIVELAIINRALGLHEHTPLASTIAQITHLVTFRQQHEPCGSVIFTLRDQLAKIKASLLEQNNQHLRERLRMARQQSTSLFKAEKMLGMEKIEVEQKYPRFESLEQFMKAEYGIKLKKNFQRNGRMKLSHSVSEYYLPMEWGLSGERGRGQGKSCREEAEAGYNK